MSHLVQFGTYNFSVPDRDTSSVLTRVSRNALRSEGLKPLQDCVFNIPRTDRALATDVNLAFQIQFENPSVVSPAVNRTTANLARIRGSYFTFIRSLIIKCNGVPLSTTQNFGALQNTLMNLTYSKSQKSSASTYLGSAENMPDSLCGRTFNVDDDYDGSSGGGVRTCTMDCVIPLSSILSDDQAIVLDSSTFEITVNWAPLSDVYECKTNDISDYTINRARVLYNQLQLSPENWASFYGLNVSNDILQYSTSSWQYSSAQLAANAQGNIHVPFSLSCSNASGAILMFHPVDAASSNISSVFPVFSHLQFNVGGKYYPNAPHSLVHDPARLLYETKQFAFSNKSNCMDISNYFRSDTPTNQSKKYVLESEGLSNISEDEPLRGQNMSYLWIPFTNLDEVDDKSILSGPRIDNSFQLNMIIDRPLSVAYTVSVWVLCSQSVLLDFNTKIVTNMI